MWTESIIRRVTQPRVWLACVFFLIAAQCARQVYSAKAETQTWDEGFNFTAGYTILTTGDYRVDPIHPPLGRVLNTLPLLFFHPDPKFDTPAWQKGDDAAHGRQFLYHNRVPAETMLFSARLVTIALTTAFAFVLAFWTRARFGAAASLLALLLFTLDPTISAHGHYVTSDLLAAFTIFLACIAFERFLRKQGRWELLWAGLALGAALASKSSSLVLFPAILALFAWQWWRGRIDLITAAKHFIDLTAIALCVVMLVYGPETVKSIRGWMNGTAPTVGQNAPRNTVIGYGQRVLGRHLKLPVHPWLSSLYTLVDQNARGRPSYLFGVVRPKGVWYYFPFAFLMKTPLGTLSLLALCVPLAFRRTPLDLAPLAVPLALYWILTIPSLMNIGVRHLLPTYPLMYVLMAVLWTVHSKDFYRRAAPIAASVAIALLVVESIRIIPNDIAFFNLAAGGPRNGPNLLVDSNIDWGQDMATLKSWIDAHGKPEMCVSYFGNAEQEYYGVFARRVPSSSEIAAGVDPGCQYAAVSVTPLMGVYVPYEDFAWLRARKPVDRAGWSIYIYDMREAARR